MPAMSKIPDDHPLMKAWREYRETDEFLNTEKWARYFVVKPDQASGAILIAHPHLDGSLWAVFEAGFRAGQAAT